MPTERKKSEIHRALKKKKMGASGKSFRENKGTTSSLPLTGAPLPSLRYGRPIKAELIKVPVAKKTAPGRSASATKKA